MERLNEPAIPRSVLWMVLLSFVLQVAAIGVFRQYHTRTGEDNFGFGFEMGRVGRAVALGQGFSNPYGGNTGPSAWEPPLYPYLMAGVFKLSGIYSYASAWVLLTINSLFAALTTIPIFLIARRTFGDRVAIWSAWGWALNPYTVSYTHLDVYKRQEQYPSSPTWQLFQLQRSQFQRNQKDQR